MAITVNILEAKNRLSQLVRSVQAGEEIVIANRGRPVARLVAASSSTADHAEKGSAAAILGWLCEHPLPPYARRPAAEIDAAIEREREAWN